MRTHTNFDLEGGGMGGIGWYHRAYGSAPYGTGCLWKDLEEEVMNVRRPYWNHRTITCFPSLPIVTFLFKYSPLRSHAHPVIFFLPFGPPPSPLPFFIFFPPHLHSFLSAIPSYTLCPLTLNHRWTKQWTVSHSIKTNNPVTGGWLCGAGAAVTRHYARWVQAATNLRQRWFNSQMDI